MQEATDFLYENLGAIPSQQYGPINLFPFAYDSDETNALKREVAQGIVQILRDAGFLKDEETTSQGPSREIVLHCRVCSAELFSTYVNDSGIANVSAVHTISAISRLNTECPHNPVTLDDQRRAIEQAVLAASEG